MMDLIKNIASKFPKGLQRLLKRFYYQRQISNRNFVSREYEFTDLHNWIKEGDWVIDVGANVGHYTMRMSELVGESGRVLAFEPIPSTFEMLTVNMANIPRKNISLFNVAASDTSSVKGMSIPKHSTGLYNYYRAQITTNSPDFNILCLSIDSLNLPKSVSLVKIDAEGHDINVLKGMESLLTKNHPLLIVEDNSNDIELYLKSFGYSSERIKNSHNRVFSVKKI